MADETVFEFPCAFPIKAMGRATPEFAATIRSLIERHTGPIADHDIRSAPSRNGRFVSITVTVSAQSRRQLDAIYRDVTSHADVLMVL